MIYCTFYIRASFGTVCIIGYRFTFYEHVCVCVRVHTHSVGTCREKRLEEYIPINNITSVLFEFSP